MGVKTKEEYIESLRQMKPTAYMFGEKISDIVDNPRLRPGIEATGATYELAQKDEYRDLMLTRSPLIDETVNRFTLPPGSIEDLVARVKINRALGNWVGTCHQRCTGLDCLSALSIVCYDIDQKHSTNYFERFTNFLKHVQKNDLTCNAGVTDVKGDAGEWFGAEDERIGIIGWPRAPCAVFTGFVRISCQRVVDAVVEHADHHAGGCIDELQLVRAVGEKGGIRRPPWPRLDDPA